MFNSKLFLSAWLIATWLAVLYKPAIVSARSLNSSTITAGFNEKTIAASEDSIIDLNIFLNSFIEKKISAATIKITYPSYMVDYIESSASSPNKECLAAGYKLDQTLATKNDKKKGVLEISKVLIAPDTVLPSGHFCFETLQFKIKHSFWYLFPWFKTAPIRFSDTDYWQIVGPNTPYTMEDEKNLPQLSITVTN